MTQITLHQVREALQLPPRDPDDVHLHMAPEARRALLTSTANAKPAGVLVLLYPSSDGLRFVLTKRPATLRQHSGQISFPGGRQDPADESLLATALRETCEELGLCDPDIALLGSLTPLYVPPTNFLVYPVVGYLPALPPLQPNPLEVAEVIHVDLDRLLDLALQQREPWTFAGGTFDIPFYAFAGHKVWGATAIMLAELEMRLRAVVGA
ncbi:MAG: CoA pyrophosphatase [Anaerolineae bacterium]|nr:CoA pyrophosphatase [Anaerolineae bacterium]